MSINPIVYCITDEVSLRAVIHMLKDQDPSFDMLVVPRVVWECIFMLPFEWETRSLSHPHYGIMSNKIPMIDGVAIMLLGGDGRLY